MSTPEEKKIKSRFVSKSKKFVSFMFAEFLWKVCLFWMILKTDTLGMWDTIIMCSIIFTAGFVQAGWILGQAAVDRYAKMAELTLGKITPGKKEDDK